MRKRRTSDKALPDYLYPPEVYPGYAPWVDAFWELSTDRQIGFQAGPIPASAIARHTAGWPEEEASTFRTCIRAMDSVFLSGELDAEDEEKPDADDAPVSNNPARDAFRAATKARPAAV